MMSNSRVKLLKHKVHQKSMRCVEIGFLLSCPSNKSRLRG